MPTGQYSDPIRIIAFNMSELWSEDPYEDVANELRRAATSSRISNYFASDGHVQLLLLMLLFDMALFGKTPADREQISQA